MNAAPGTILSVTIIDGSESRASARSRRLSPRQADVLAFVIAYRDAHGFTPTLREIAEHLGARSHYTAADHVAALARKGFVQREHKKQRLVVLRGLDNQPTAWEPTVQPHGDVCPTCKRPR